MMNQQSLGGNFQNSEERAKELFKRFFLRYPHQANPTDINTQEKWDFFVDSDDIGFRDLQSMERCRKASKAFAKRGYFFDDGLLEDPDQADGPDIVGH